MPLPVDLADASRCPLCGGGNACASERARLTGEAPSPCWCMTARIPAALLDRVPPAARGFACLCERCAALSLPADSPVQD